jgi:hypothetical protein
MTAGELGVDELQLEVFELESGYAGMCSDGFVPRRANGNGCSDEDPAMLAVGPSRPP